VSGEDAGTYVINVETVSAGANYNLSYEGADFTISKADQTITITSITDKVITDTSLEVEASTTSELALTYSVGGPATISGTTVTLTGASGTVTITVEQSGDTNYNSTQGTVSFNVIDNSKQNQMITFTSISDKTIGDAAFDLSATASSDLTVIYTSTDESVATVSGNTIMIVGAGATTITAFQTGDDTFNAASSVAQSFMVNKQVASITFDAMASKTFGDADFDLLATVSSNLEIVYSSSDESVATIVGNTVSIVGAGSTEITASQDGDATFKVATSVSQTLTVNKADQTVSFDALSETVFGDVDFDLVATVSSGLSITYASSDETVATIVGSTVSIIGAGTATMTATQSGNHNFNAAASVSLTLTVNTSDQVITITSIADKVITDTSLEVEASTTSGLDLTYAVTGPATILGTTITLTGVSGTVIVTVDQDGNSNYSSAQGTTSFNVIDDSKQDQSITFEALADKVFEDGAFTITATASSNLAVSLEVVSGAATIDNGTVTITGAGDVVVKATQGGDGTFNPAPEVTQGFNVAKKEQTITITTIADKLTTDAAFDVEASTDSDLALTYAVTGSASISGATLTLDGTSGMVEVIVSQSGDDNFNEAEATVSFEVTAPVIVKSDQLITITTIADKLTTDSAFDVEASTDSDLVLTYAVTGPANISGATITLEGTVGTVTVTVSQSGDDSFNAAETTVSFEVTAPVIVKSDQLITITTIADKLTTDSAFDVEASTDSDLALTYAVTGPASISGATITLEGTVGTVTVTVSQSGDDNFNAADATVSFEVTELVKEKSDQLITITTIVDKLTTDAAFDVEASTDSDL
ncbi:MAG: hypothetical protein OCD76_22645, partial [Reichenbachiella sp.]